jgi:hypothetical protein
MTVAPSYADGRPGRAASADPFGGVSVGASFPSQRRLSMRIAVTGSIAYDYLMRFPGRFKDHFIADRMESVSLSFLVDSMVRQRGGVAANIAYTMRLLGGEPVIFATVGACRRTPSSRSTTTSRPASS